MTSVASESRDEQEMARQKAGRVMSQKQSVHEQKGGSLVASELSGGWLSSPERQN